MITLSGDITAAGMVTLSAESVVSDSGSTITSEGLTFDNVSAAGAADARLRTNIDNLYLIDSGSVYLDEQSGLTIARMNATDVVDMSVSNGSVLGVNRDYEETPDIIANNAVIDVSTDFGTAFRPISVNVNNEFTLLSDVSSVYFFGREPNIVNDKSTIKISIFDALLDLSGQQLIEVESLSEIDPAIFTEVRNYNQDELSILLPADQRYDDDNEDDDEGGQGARP